MARKAAMTEETWQTSSDFRLLLPFFKRMASCRKQRLFLCALWRHFFSDVKTDREAAVYAVETAERYADGLATKAEVVKARQALGSRNRAAWWTTFGRLNQALLAMPLNTLPFTQYVPSRVDPSRFDDPRDRLSKNGILCDLFRNLLGNPFRPVEANAGWLAWHDGTIPKLAQVIYGERRFQELPILADALEDAGCANEELLQHCREPGEHVRGCWVIDLLTGKE
jgi:hypothetical protein